MGWFEGSHHETFTVPSDLATTRRHFSDPATIVKHTEGLQSHAIEGEVVHFVMTPQDHGVVKFAGDYRCRYTLTGDTLRWSWVSGNTKQSGEATFRSVPAGTEVVYREDLQVEVDVNALMAPMLKLVMGPMLAHEAKEYVRRMAKSLGG
jgi:hypothetical protein